MSGILADFVADCIQKPADFKLEARKYYTTASGERIGPMHAYKTFAGFWAAGNAGWWDKNGRGRATEGGSVPDLIAIASNQEDRP